MTGDTGFIGSTLANRLAADNEVTVVDNEYLGTEENADSGVRCLRRDVSEDDLPTDVDVVFYEASKLHAATGWEPTVDFESGIERVWEPYLVA